MRFFLLVFNLFLWKKCFTFLPLLSFAFWLDTLFFFLIHVIHYNFFFILTIICFPTEVCDSSVTAINEEKEIAYSFSFPLVPINTHRVWPVMWLLRTNQQCPVCMEDSAVIGAATRKCFSDTRGKTEPVEIWFTRLVSKCVYNVQLLSFSGSERRHIEFLLLFSVFF